MPATRPYLALDPGTTGALALVEEKSVLIFDIPVTVEKTAHGKRSRLDLEGLGTLCHFLSAFDPVLVTESVAGRRGDNPFSIGELTRSAGAVEAALAAAGVSVAFRLSPVEWKRGLGLLRIPKDRRKLASLEMARALFPDCGQFTRAKDHNRAEAALIGYWARLAGPPVAVTQHFPAKRRKKRSDTKNVFC